MSPHFFLLLVLGTFGASAAPALDWQSGSGFRVATFPVTPSAVVGFSNLPPSLTGITFSNTIPEQKHLTNQILLNGSGVAAGDIDGDGWCDLYFCRVDGSNALYRNLGNWKFEEITAQAGVALEGLVSTGCAFIDLDGDGDLDLVVNTLGHGTRILYNDGRGHFTPAKEVFNLGQGGMSLAAGDLNQDGYLDLYIANYRTLGLMDVPNARATFKRVDGKTVIETFDGKPATDPAVTNRFLVGPRGNIEEQGEPDLILFSDHGTNFSRIGFASDHFLDEQGQPLTHDLVDWGLSVMIRDMNGDGLPDIYVCNDFQTPDRFWINQGRGQFKLLPRLAQRRTSMFSMGIDVADLNRDGFDDFLVLDMVSRRHAQRMRDLVDNTPIESLIGVFYDRPQYSMNTLFLNRGDNTYAEISQLSGVQASDWSWSCVFLDVDLDGWEDILISNGMERAARDLDVAAKMKQLRASRRMADREIFEARRAFPRLATPNVAFHNERNGKFRECGAEWHFAEEGVANGMALADLDNDGDLDVIVNNLNGPAGVYRNEAGAPRVAVRLKGLPPNTRGIGARVTLSGGGLPSQSQEIIAGGRYLSSDDPMRSFAAGSGNGLSLEVRWPNGKKTRIDSVHPNALYEIDEASSPSVPATTENAPVGQPLFEDASAMLSFRHFDQPFDDYARQPLLFRKLSQPGPGVGWIDLNHDGWDDLVIANGKGAPLGIFLNRQSVLETNAPAKVGALPREALAIAAWRSGTNGAGVLVSLANYEDGLRSGAAVREFNLGSSDSRDVVAADESSAGPIALADIDLDGSLDLFVGGRVIAANYPAPAASRLFRWENGAFILDKQNTAVLAGAGLVSGAVFSDLNADGYPDLVLACEWGPVRVYLNERGHFREATSELGLARFTGWWNSVAAADFDGDGRMDFVAGNWGENTPYESFRTRPLRCYYGDFDNDGTFDLVLTQWDTELQKYVPEKQLDALVKALPFVSSRFKSNAQYSTAGVEEILGPQLKTAKMVEANWLESSVFLNRGDHFEVRPLPLEAQFAPVFGIGLADFNGDGSRDILLAQNFFAVEPGTPRYDGGRGLLLKGDGHGNFRPVSGQESGIAVYGEQRGLAVADYDHDGRPDVAIGQNGAAAKIYHNLRGTPGLRLKLSGNGSNPDAVGARFRFIGKMLSGPMQELHSGSGYLSQDSFTTIVRVPDVGEIRVWWPDGTESAAPVTPAMTELEIREAARAR